MSARKRYEELFQSDVFKEPGTDRLSKYVTKKIAWAQKTLIKNDRVIWYLKKIKHIEMTCNIDMLSKKDISWALKYEQSGALNKDQLAFSVYYNGSLKDSVDDIYNRIKEADDSHPPIKSSYTSFSSVINHYLDLNISKINNYTLINQNEDEIINYFSSIEKEWRENLRVKSLEPYGELVLTTKSGGRWYDLQTPGCEREGERMAHCGNGEGEPGQNIYSLRFDHEIYEGKENSRVTLVVNDTATGVVGEIKGYANEKPGKEFHPDIVEFLSSGLVTKLEGGGYKPENNFQLSDLSDEHVSELYSKNPGIFSSYDLWKMNGEKVDGRVLERVHAEFLDTGLLSASDDGYLRLKVFNEIDGKEIETSLLINKDTMAINREPVIKFLVDKLDYLVEIYDAECGHAIAAVLLDKENTGPAQALKTHLNLDYGYIIKGQELDLSCQEDIHKLLDLRPINNTNKICKLLQASLISGIKETARERGPYDGLKNIFKSIAKEFPSFESSNDAGKLWSASMSIEDGFKFISKLPNCARYEKSGLTDLAGQFSEMVMAGRVIKPSNEGCAKDFSPNLDVMKSEMITKIKEGMLGVYEEGGPFTDVKSASAITRFESKKTDPEISM